MDPITTAIVAALSAGAISGLTDMAKTAISDGYNKLKAAIQKRFGQGHAVVKAVEDIETKPTSQGRQRTLAEEVTEAGADRDAELLALAEHIHQLLKEHAKDNTAIQQIITGNYNATSVHGDAAVTVDHSKDV